MSNEMKDWYAENEQEKKLLMKKKNLIKGLEVMKAEVEWNYPLDYCIIIDEVIKVLEGTAAEYIEQVTNNNSFIEFTTCELYAVRDGLKKIILDEKEVPRKRDEAFNAQLKVMNAFTKKFTSENDFVVERRK